MLLRWRPLALGRLGRSETNAPGSAKNDHTLPIHIRLLFLANAGRTGRT